MRDASLGNGKAWELEGRKSDGIVDGSETRRGDISLRHELKNCWKIMKNPPSTSELLIQSGPTRTCIYIYVSCRSTYKCWLIMWKWSCTTLIKLHILVQINIPRRVPSFTLLLCDTTARVRMLELPFSPSDLEGHCWTNLDANLNYRSSTVPCRCQVTL